MVNDWRQFAECAGADPALFYPPRGMGGPDTVQAKAMCAECPVVAECLRYALDNFTTADDFGVWGGTSVRERRRMRRDRRRMAACWLLSFHQAPTKS